MIDCLYEEWDCKDRDYQSIIEYVDLFYAEDAAAMVPRTISKHYVRNKDGKGNYACLCHIVINCSNVLCLFLFAGMHAEWLLHVDKSELR
jgi:hypothetical protein